MLRSLAILVVILFTYNLYAAERVILLAPAAADIMMKLGCEKQIIGKTKSVEAFPNAVKVGSHIKPNLELIISQNPDMIIVSSNRFFTEEMAKQVKVPVITYNPVTLDGILTEIEKLGKLMNKEKEADQLTVSLKEKLNNVKIPVLKPSVLYEVMQIPYTLAGERNIVTDIIRKAGGNPLLKDKKKLVKYSIESAISMNPDFYIYQVGPMNKAPVPPQERPAFQVIHPEYLKVDEKLFSRANTNSFDNILTLNKLFNKEN